MHWDSSPRQYRECLRPKIKRGHGVEQNENYKSWFGLRKKINGKDFSVPFGLIANRRYHLRSIQAESFLFLLERLRGMLDIKEDLPILDVDATLNICGSMGVEHEYRRHDVAPFIVDFMASRTVGDQTYHTGYTLWPSSKPLAGRDLERTLVVREWCERTGLAWSLIDTAPLTPQVNSALTFVRGWHRHRYEPEKASIERFAGRFRRAHRRGATLEEILAEICAKSGEPSDHTANHFRYAAWAGFIQLDLTQPLALNQPVAAHVNYGR